MEEILWISTYILPECDQSFLSHNTLYGQFNQYEPVWGIAVLDQVSSKHHDCSAFLLQCSLTVEQQPSQFATKWATHSPHSLSAIGLLYRVSDLQWTGKGYYTIYKGFGLWKWMIMKNFISGTIMLKDESDLMSIWISLKRSWLSECYVDW